MPWGKHLGVCTSSILNLSWPTSVLCFSLVWQGMMIPTNQPNILLFGLCCIVVFCFYSFPMVIFSWLSQSNRGLLTPANQPGAQAQGCVISVFFYWCWQCMSRLAGCILLTRMEAGEGAGLCVFLHHSLSYTIVTTRVNLRLFKSSTPNSHLFLSFFPTETMLQLISLDVSLYILGLLLLWNFSFY